MSERTFNEIAQANLDHFLSHPQHAEKRQEYIDRGLVHTNNLCMYFFENSQEELMPGLPHPYDYRGRPYGPILQAFREANPELWEEARIAAEESSAAMQEAVDLMEEKREEIAQVQPLPVKVRDRRKVMSRILKVSVPEPEVVSVETFDFLGALPEDVRQAADQAYWKKAEVYTRVYKILTPELEAAGIDPLDVCR